MNRGLIMNKYVLGLFILSSSLVLVSCSNNEAVKNGPVRIKDSLITKYCDGTTLVYSKPGALAIETNSPQCK